jgi:tetratricopeptide (TPR) repeat protein
MAESEENLVLTQVEKIEHFVENNKQTVGIVAGVVVALIAAILFITLKWLPERNNNAKRAMFMAEIAFQKDSFNLALNGNGINKGFKDIKSKYSWTKSANLCNYYIGLCQLNLGKYADAASALESFRTKDPVLGAAKFNALGDAYAEQNKADEAIKNYEKAAYFSDNEQFSPYYLLKLGNYLEFQNKFKEALEKYTEIKTKYPQSEEMRDLEKYIARATAQL